MTVRQAWRRIVALHDAYFVGRWRAGLRGEVARQEDAWVALLFLEAFGIESPAAYHTLELRPELVEAFHRWHQREGVDRLSEAGICC